MVRRLARHSWSGVRRCLAQSSVHLCHEEPGSLPIVEQITWPGVLVSGFRATEPSGEATVERRRKDLFGGARDLSDVACISSHAAWRPCRPCQSLPTSWRWTDGPHRPTCRRQLRGFGRSLLPVRGLRSRDIEFQIRSPAIRTTNLRKMLKHHGLKSWMNPERP